MYFSRIWLKTQRFSFKKLHLKVFVKWWPFCTDLSVFTLEKNIVKQAHCMMGKVANNCQNYRIFPILLWPYGNRPDWNRVILLVFFIFSTITVLHSLEIKQKSSGIIRIKSGFFNHAMKMSCSFDIDCECVTVEMNVCDIVSDSRASA